MKHPLIRTIYLYLFALVGLTLVVIGSVRFVDMGLKAFVFTQADEDRYLYRYEPTTLPAREVIQKEEDGEVAIVRTELTEAEHEALTQWIEDYKRWQDRQSQVDPLVADRHRDASINLAMMVIGLPLYLYHWTLIRRETKE